MKKTGIVIVVMLAVMILAATQSSSQGQGVKSRQKTEFRIVQKSFIRGLRFGIVSTYVAGNTLTSSCNPRTWVEDSSSYNHRRDVLGFGDFATWDSGCIEGRMSQGYTS